MSEGLASNTFQAIWFAPSLILGLGVTRLFSDAITLFRARATTRIDWIPLVWAMSIFVWQLQYLWAIIELPSYVHHWSLLDFLLLIGLSLCLFVSGALVLPDAQLQRGEDLAHSFMQDGRWSLVALAGWGVLALITDWSLFESDFLSLDTGLMTASSILPISYLLVRQHTLRALITMGNLIVTVLAAWVLSPKLY